ncbi:MAG: HlyD family efflux transporter periplasmic adaptor subunit [Rhodobacter sp.]|uniref:efflux RND transporter periplasmic adaptor subunit n=1 Tax=Pararhodobacter sp. TaxID=2127056 RepID=UPI001DD650C5|nr:HlyD family efflux transporter periplasmic adaptor subunit [Pararhodobacter sp.]MCB1345592.1 HlyD family efflux transporter periplasmic adaptor subunit [Paracoccaceae bacterium]MCC0073026.1 HlyD family efflux transporter periplasmic adaptor subunit [Rhodobacter sp.]HPD91961.1 HlyD family efflux transporter periplasmic adaptor subunit [Pararhodobacter sp.]
MRFLTRSIVALFLGAMALGLLAVAGGMVRSTIEARAARQDAPRVARERVFAARVVTIEPGAVAPVLSAFGEVVSRRTLELRATAAGRILTLADGFEEGAPVRAGEVLVQLDPADAEAARDLVRADLARAEDERDDARRALELSHLDRAEAESQADIRRRAFERQQGLAERGIGTAATVEDAELAYAAARASVIARRQAEAAAQARVTTAENALERQRINLAEAERRVADTTVTASFDGVLSDTNAVAGGQVSMNERLASVIDPGALEVSFRLSTAQYLRLLDGQGALMPARAEIALEMGGAEITSPGTLTRVAPSVGAGQSGRLVYAAIDAPRGFRPGDFVTVRITEPVLPGVAQVPASAVDSTGGVLVLGAEDRLEAASVEVVRRQGDSVLIRAPALAGRDVVAARNPLLGVGIRVRPQRDQGAAAAQPEAPDLVALDPERRAALIARVSSNTMMPEGVRTRILAQLEQEQVPARLIERLEQGGGRPRQGG